MLKVYVAKPLTQSVMDCHMHSEHGERTHTHIQLGYTEMTHTPITTNTYVWHLFIYFVFICLNK